MSEKKPLRLLGREGKERFVIHQSTLLLNKACPQRELGPSLASSLVKRNTHPQPTLPALSQPRWAENGETLEKLTVRGTGSPRGWVLTGGLRTLPSPNPSHPLLKTIHRSSFARNIMLSYQEKKSQDIKKKKNTIGRDRTSIVSETRHGKGYWHYQTKNFFILRLKC